MQNLDWVSTHFKAMDKTLSELLKEQNKMFESIKPKIVIEAKKNLNKKHFDENNVGGLSPYVLENISKQLYFDEINNITIDYYLKIVNEAYQDTVKYVSKYAEELEIEEEIIEKTKKEELKKSYLIELNASYNEGVKYTYNSEIENRKNYFNTQITNGINEQHFLYAKEYNGKNYTQTIYKILNQNSLIMLKVYLKQKKSFSRFMEDYAVSIFTKTQLKAYKDLGIEKIIRIGEPDARQCKICEGYMGEIYTIGEETPIPTHLYCRCYYLPYIEKESV